MTSEHLSELRALATAATAGPWTWVFYPDGRKLLCAPEQAVIHCPDSPMGIESADSDYIAAVDPQTLLALLDALDEAQP